MTSQAPPTAPAPARKPPLPALTGLRTLLALNVLLFHFTPPHPPFLSPFINNAYVFVGFFFLISGFVLAYNYADLPSLSRRTFYLARVSRVYPVYLLVLLLSFPFLKIEWHARPHAEFIQGVILTPLALQAWSPSLATFWNTVGWTVPAEFLLYALFPFLLLLLKTQRDRLATPHRIAGAIGMLWVVGILPHLAYFLVNPDHLTTQANRFTYGTWLRVLKYNPAAYLCTFSAGVLLARLHALWPLRPRQRGVLAGSALCALLLFFYYAIDRIPYVLMHGSLLLPLFSLLMLGLAGPNAISSVFAWRPLVLFGETTFALYLVHFNAFLLIHYYRLPQRLHLSRFEPWISYAAVILLAFLVFRFYERPARRLFLSLVAPKQ